MEEITIIQVEVVMKQETGLETMKEAEIEVMAEDEIVELIQTQHTEEKVQQIQELQEMVILTIEEVLTEEIQDLAMVEDNNYFL